MTSLQKPEWLTEFKELLKCASCHKTVMDLPVHRCANEHLLCENCQLTHGAMACPKCAGVMNLKCVIVENMLKTLPKHKCLFEGCDFARADEQTLAAHQTTCVHRPILCYTCYESVPVSGMASHLMAKHQHAKTWNVNIGQTQSLHCPLRSANGAIYSDGFLVLEDGVTHTFFLNVTVEEGRYLFWVTHPWTSSDSNDRCYKYTATLSEPKEGNVGGIEVASHKGFCTSHDCHPTSMKKSLFCLVVPEDVIKKSTNSEDRFQLDTTIIKAWSLCWSTMVTRHFSLNCDLFSFSTCTWWWYRVKAKKWL